MPPVTTKRLVLSQIASDDAEELAAMLLNPALYDFIGDAPQSPAEANARVARWLTGSPDPDMLWVNYVARSRDDGRLVGLAQATVLRDADSESGSGFGECEIAYLVNPPEQHHGFCTEMMTAFCGELQETLRPKEFTAHIRPGHAASEGVAKSLGLTPTTDYVAGEQVWRKTAPRTHGQLGTA